MIKREFNLAKPYRVVLYARMSTKKQNKRSPEQQVATIKETIERFKCPWTILRTYVDRGMKARYLRRRPSLQGLLRDIEAGLIEVDLIVVDTFERFGRADEFEEIRRKLRDNHGVLIVCADNNFADPTGMVGKAVGMVEQIRATEDTRIKAHNVVRGKKDCLRQKRWPGGPPPFGYGLTRLWDSSGPELRPYSILKPAPVTGPIVRAIYQKAFETNWGGSKLATFFNADESIPAEFKPFYAATIDYWLANEIYVGVGVWGLLSTDIVNDARVIEANRPEEVLRVEEFCEPLVSREVFDAIRAVRRARSEAWNLRREESAKLIEPLSPGLSLKHSMAGLVHCGECNACSVPRSSGRRSKAGQTYAYYTCSRHNDGACGNGRHIRIDQLKPAVFSRLRQRLFPCCPGAVPEWFPRLVGKVEAQLVRMHEAQPVRSDEVRHELWQIEEQVRGWTQSLGNPALAAVVRQDLEQAYAQAKQRTAQLRSELECEEAIDRHLREVLDPRQVADGLQRLEQVLASENPSVLNLELAKHIERIDCYSDGRVVLRGTWLGLFEGAVDLLRGADFQDPVLQKGTIQSEPEQADPPDGGSTLADALPSLPLPKVRSRRLARRRVSDLSAFAADGGGGGDAGQDALDPQRFAGLAECFIWEEEFLAPGLRCWSETHASAVSAHKQRNPTDSLVKIAAHFGKSVPTIREALQRARLRDTPTTPPVDGDAAAAADDDDDHGPDGAGGLGEGPAAGEEAGGGDADGRDAA